MCSRPRTTWRWRARTCRSFQNIVEVNATRVRAGDLAKVELVRTQVAALQFQNAVRQAEAKLKIARQPTARPDGPHHAVARVRRGGSPAARHGPGGAGDGDRAGAGTASRPAGAAPRPGALAGRDPLATGAGQGRFHGGHRVSPASSTTATPTRWASSSRRRCRCSTGTRARSSARGGSRNRSWRASAPPQADVQNEVRNAWVQYATSRGLLESIEHDLLDQAREVRSTMEYSYRRGEASLVEFLDAQRAFNDARQSAQRRARRFRAQPLHDRRNLRKGSPMSNQIHEFSWLCVLAAFCWPAAARRRKRPRRGRRPPPGRSALPDGSVVIPAGFAEAQGDSRGRSEDAPRCRSTRSRRRARSRANPNLVSRVALPLAGACRGDGEARRCGEARRPAAHAWNRPTPTPAWARTCRRRPRSRRPRPTSTRPRPTTTAPPTCSSTTRSRRRTC